LLIHCRLTKQKKFAFPILWFSLSKPFLGYVEQKNFALSKATFEHVLSLDADEALSDELITSVQKEKEKGFPADGYTMNRFNFYCGKWIRHGTYYPDRKLRLFNLKKGQWGGQNPHDKIIMAEDATIKHLKGDLLHYTYQTIGQHAKQMERFSTIAAKALYDKGKKPSYFKMLINPAWAFIKGYVIKLGFLDGVEGFRIASYTARQAYLKYLKLIRLHRESK
jgi:hypothetical protein